MSKVHTQKPILILGGTGKTGRRVADRLKARGRPVRIASRSSKSRFDWNDPSTWAPVLQGVSAVYITYQPDLAVPGAVQSVSALTHLALASGVSRIVLLSGRGEEEAQQAEKALQNSGADWTIVRASWFAQNFSESFLLDSVLAGEVALPVGGTKEPFIDADDIADVVVEALSDPSHIGQLYEVTGPRLLTFGDAVQNIAKVSGRNIRYTQVSTDEYVAMLESYEVPSDYISLVTYLFTTVLDGRNANLTDGVHRVLGRQPRDFSDYAQDTAAMGAWSS